MTADPMPGGPMRPAGDKLARWVAASASPWTCSASKSSPPLFDAAAAAEGDTP